MSSIESDRGTIQGGRQIAEVESKLAQALGELLALIKSAGSGPQGEQERGRFERQVGLIDELGAALPTEAGELRHFIERHSYQKALDLIAEGKAARGACR